MSTEIHVKIIFQNRIMRRHPPGNIDTCRETRKGHPARVNLVHHHKHLLRGRINNDIPQVMTHSGKKQFQGLVPRLEVVHFPKRDIRKGTTMRIVGRGELFRGIFVRNNHRIFCICICMWRGRRRREKIGATRVVGVRMRIDEPFHREGSQVGNGMLQVMAERRGRVDNDNTGGGNQDERLVDAVGYHVGAMGKWEDGVARGVEGRLVGLRKRVVEGEELVMPGRMAKTGGGSGDATEEEKNEEGLHGGWQRQPALRSME